MRVVVDTNVVSSGVFWHGTPGRILEAWLAGAFVLVVTAAILEEYFEVLDRVAAKIGRTVLASHWKTFLFDHAEMVTPPTATTAAATRMMPCSLSAPSAAARPTWSAGMTIC